MQSVMFPGDIEADNPSSKLLSLSLSFIGFMWWCVCHSLAVLLPTHIQLASFPGPTHSPPPIDWVEPGGRG